MTMTNSVNLSEENIVPAEQYETPFFDAVLKYINDKTLTFHVPGHQQGRGAAEKLINFIGMNVLAADVTQVPGLDDLHQPKDSLLKAQILTAKAYGADKSYFLINGSSSGNHAMIISSVRHGEKIIMPRNVHRSVIGALILSGAVPVFVEPEFDEGMQVDHTITKEKLEIALNNHPDAVAVMIISPTYYGATADLPELINLIHSKGKIALVDEAWGAHLNFHPDLPVSATEAGADLCINSTHKLSLGVSQTSMLHKKGNLVDTRRLESALRLFLSTSPNGLMLISMDIARMQMATEGKKLLERTINLAKWGRDEINNVPGLHCYGDEIIGRPGVYDFDLTRLVITAKEIGFTGYQLENLLRQKHNIQIEMSDLFNIVALITVGHSMQDLEKLILALKDITKNEKRAEDLKETYLFDKKLGLSVSAPDWPMQRMTPRDAFMEAFEEIEFRKSCGRVCAELVTPYPPGIPILCPGEEISKEIIDYLCMELEAGIKIQGSFDPELKMIRVIK